MSSVHKTHKTRLSDSSLYDEVCTLCGATDRGSSLERPCPARSSGYLTTFEVPVDIRLDSSQLRDANRALNLHYTGKSFVPMHETVGSEHRDAAYGVHATHRKTIRVGLLPNGSLEIIE